MELKWANKSNDFPRSVLSGLRLLNHLFLHLGVGLGKNPGACSSAQAVLEILIKLPISDTIFLSK